MVSVAERARVLALALALAVTAAPLAARAQTTGAAEMLFEEGRRLLESRDVAAACAKFAESQRLEPAGGTLMNLAACHERAGKTATGSITGFYTVLVEGDDFNEPIPDAVKGIADGHLWLSRSLANRGHFPAIDVLQSISRVRGDVCDADQQKAARRLLALTAVYYDIEDLVNIGAYAPGASLEYDVAVQSRPKIVEFLRQEAFSPAPLERSRKQAIDLAAWTEQLEKTLKAQAAKPARAAAAK